MLIETTRLIVRPFREKDADTLYRIKSDPQVMEFCPDFLDVDAKQAPAGKARNPLIPLKS